MNPVLLLMEGYSSNQLFEKTISTEEIIKVIRALPKKERDKLKSDTDELNDYILRNYPDYYKNQVELVKYTIPGAIERYMELLADKI